MQIEIDEISKEFGTTAALTPVSLSIPSGALVALLGPSGSGKTTLLRILGGLEFPTAGRVLFDGADATRLTVQERRAGFVFQSYALFPHMTVDKNIGYGLKHEAMSHSDRAARVREMLDLVQLTQFATRKPHQISGGQRQRALVARALVRRPRLIVLDEPTEGLDVASEESFLATIDELHRAEQLTLLFVTHKLRIAGVFKELEAKIVATGAWDKDIEAQFKQMISEFKATGSW